MSTELKGTTALNGEVGLTRYFGGRENGMCVQATPQWPQTYLCLTKEQALDLAAALIEFVNGKRQEEDD